MMPVVSGNSTSSASMPKKPATAPVVIAAAVCSRGLACAPSAAPILFIELCSTNSSALWVELLTVSTSASGARLPISRVTASTGMPSAELMRIASDGFSSRA